MLVGIRSDLALAVGAVAGLLGILGLAVLLVPANQPVTERRRYRHVPLVIGSVLLAVCGLALIGVGIAAPLRSILNRDRFHFTTLMEATNQHLRIANRLRCAEAIRTILSQPKYQDRKKLNLHEYRVFSQNGEDGMIAEIFRRIGTTNRYFVEFGAADGMENNTVLLLRQGWSGLWIDGDPESIDKARKHFRPEIDDKKLTVVESFITAENIEDLFRQSKVPEEIDLLSVDIDRNDYYVWEKITHYRPRAVIVEYNPLFPPTMSWVIPYDPKAWWDQTSHTGASLKALEELAVKKGYRLVGCCISGVNAFFIRDDLLGDHFAEPFTAENHYEPSRYDIYNHDSNHPRVP